MRYDQADAPSAVEPDPTDRDLREQLRHAVLTEQFELAAELRDRLKDRE
jgi:protein-arginine kinase activator protein McsA